MRYPTQGWDGERMRPYNWRKHNTIKAREFEFLLYESMRIIDDAQEPWAAKHMGRPPYASKAMTSICLLKVYFNMPYRDIESLLRANQSFQETLGLDSVPDHNTIQRSMEKIPLDYLQHLNGQLTVAFKKNAKTLPSMQLDSASEASTSPGRR